MHDLVCDGLVRASISFSREKNVGKLIAVLLELMTDYTLSDLAAFYRRQDKSGLSGSLELVRQTAGYGVPPKIPQNSLLSTFIDDCREVMVIHWRSDNPFQDILMNELMNSGMAIPVNAGKNSGIILLNSRYESRYGKSSLQFAESLSRMIEQMLRRNENG